MFGLVRQVPRHRWRSWFLNRKGRRSEESSAGARTANGPVRTGVAALRRTKRWKSRRAVGRRLLRWPADNSRKLALRENEDRLAICRVDEGKRLTHRRRMQNRRIIWACLLGTET